MTDFLAILLVALPWMFGGTVAMFLARQCSSIHGMRWIAAGTGGLLGYQLLAILAWPDTLASRLAFSYGFFFYLGIATFFSLLGYAFSIDRRLYRRSNTPSSAVGLVHVSAILLLVAYVLIAVYQHVNLPTFGWDVLDHWAPAAQKVAIHNTAPIHNSFEYRHRHPLTLPVITAWSAWGGKELPLTAIGGVSPWLMFSFSAAIVAAGYALSITGSQAIALISAILLLNVPLTENHYLVGGYGELAIGTALISGTAICSLGLKFSSKWLIGLGLIIALTAAIFKNTGIVYGAAPVIAALLTLAIYRPSTRIYLSLGLVIACLGVYFMFSNGLIILFGNKIGWKVYPPSIYFGGWRLDIVQTEFFTIIRNIRFSLFINQSFSLSVFLIFIGSIFACVRGDHRSKKPMIFICVTIFVVLSILIISQFTEYGLNNAVPENDIGNSRFSIPPMMLSTLLFPHLISLFSGWGNQSRAPQSLVK